ncbi:hypothetical protein BUALT_Bualt10G0134900 [Buddleja alternifolia]|uniref:AB hydrolase-1 domain-containing protein n=1 Tax=Buddleja alternifolia TaxID=168488 RepID=A0AAV6WZ57_9LAMI|nr:hypothetical protein BUALT_Bualt10G0134900 [Buddleja alternifolia]
MGSSCLSIVSLFGSFIRRSLTAAGLSSQTVDIDDGDTTIHFWGPPAATFKPKLVLIHGFGPESMHQWRHQISFFTREFDVYMLDLVFFGESFTKSPERSELFQATWVAKLLEKLCISRYSVVGTSYGGMVAYRIAKMWPERVEKVVIASSAVNLRRRDNEELLKKVKMEKIEDLMLPSDGRVLRKLFGLVLYRTPYLPDFILNDFMEVLIVWGEHDRIFLLDKAIELKKLLGEKAKLEVIKNSGHVPQIEQAGQFNKIVNNFLHGLS